MKIYHLIGKNDFDQKICDAIEDFFCSTEESAMYHITDTTVLSIRFGDICEDEVIAYLYINGKKIKEYEGKAHLGIASNFTANRISLSNKHIHFDSNDIVKNIDFYNCTLEDNSKVHFFHCHFINCTTTDITQENVDFYECIFDSCINVANFTMSNIDHNRFINCQLYLPENGTNFTAYNRLVNCTFTCK